MTSILEKGGSGFKGIRLLLCENPLPLIEEAIAAAQAEAAHGNYITLKPIPRRCGRALSWSMNDPVLGPGYMRVTTALPEDNRRFVGVLQEVLSNAT